MSEIEPGELVKAIEGRGEGASLIAVLEDVQAHYRYLPREAMILISERSGAPLSQIFSIATFYQAFRLTPRGEHTIRVCTGTACHVRGAMLILNRLEAKLGVEPGETTGDRLFSLETVNCLGCCALGPVAVLDGEHLGQMTPRKVEMMLKRATRPTRGKR